MCDGEKMPGANGKPAGAAPPRARDDDLPIRGELLSPERLEECARDEAGARIQPGGVVRLPSPLSVLILRTRRGLESANRRLNVAVRDGAPVSTAVEWILDNSYLVEDQVRAAAEDLPPGFDAELPKLAEGPLRGYPRVWRLATVLLSHTDFRLDVADLQRFVDAYQAVSPLTMAETWALPIMLRVALADAVRRLARRVLIDLEADRAAERWAERIIAAFDTSASAADAVLEELESTIARTDDGGLSLARLAARLSAAEYDLAPAMRRIERAFAQIGVDARGLAASEHHRIASDQISIANAVTSIRLVEATDWRVFFESTSIVERHLRTDPVGVYAYMDFASRDRYRHALERLTKRTSRSEIDVASAAIDAAAEALSADPRDTVRGHVGWYLVGEGRPGLTALLRGHTVAWPSASYQRSRGGPAYVVMLIGLTALLTGLMAAYAWRVGSRPWAVALLALLSVIPLSQVATDVVNRVAAWFWPPHHLSKLDVKHPVGEAFRTLVTVPVLLTSAASAAGTVRRLEMHYLANRDPNIGFALLGELKAGPAEHMESDDAITRACVDGIAELNARYGSGSTGPFHLLLRARVYNEREGVWMGWEHKRGGLTELGRHLRGATDTSINTVVGDAGFLQGVTFVITLDADTVLPSGTARALISTIAHPLNRAQVDATRKAVTRGYGLVQPGLTMTLTSTLASRYAELHGGPSGIDQYSSAASDTYQDVFGEGSFTGKGIYEVDVFNAVLEGRIPEETLLSHDLLEGNFLRTALASDIGLLDDFPPDYATQCTRQHRWARGDWQTSPWLSTRVKGSDGRRYRNPMSALHKWKILDNLRRSLLPAALFAWGLGGWVLLPRPGMLWVPILVLAVGYPLIMHAVDEVLSILGGTSPAAVWRPWLHEAAADFERAVLTIAFLPHQALLLLDAATRAWWRVHVSRKRILEWTTAAEQQTAQTCMLGTYVRLMGVAVVGGLALMAAVAALSPSSIPFLAPVAVLWALSPVIAWWVSRPLPIKGQPAPSSDQKSQMRVVARRTWDFFETFVGQDDNWLPPDNFQEDPSPVLAHRTSPTNIGLALLANLTAHDLGYLCVSSTLERVSRTVSTLERLDSFRGHLYNWYDTRTLEPLHPRYVSTVDSGNLAAAAITLRQGLLELADEPLLGPVALDGIADTARLAIEDLGASESEGVPSAARRDLEEFARRVDLADRPGSLAAWYALLAQLDRIAAGIHVRVVADSGAESLEARIVSTVVQSVRCHLTEIEALAPWAALLAAPSAESACLELAPELQGVPSLRSLSRDPVEALSRLADIEAGDSADAALWASTISAGLRSGSVAAAQRTGHLDALAERASALWDRMDFSLVYDEGRELFSIGFNVEQGTCDNSFYDLLASECRLTSYLAVARGDVGIEHWFRLGRMLTRVGRDLTLLSWSASMFEYLMPNLFMQSWRKTLLDDTCRAVVRRQIEYGSERGVPWGISESAFNARDVEFTYQYQVFGVPGLGLKRGLADDVVIAPYATLLAAQVDRPAALRNLEALAADGALGRYGYYEAIDYTPGRIRPGAYRAVVKTYMAHHQGMSLLALGNEIDSGSMRRRFHSAPLVASAEVLLQERAPGIVEPAHPHVEEVEFVRAKRAPVLHVERSYTTPDTPSPATHFLSNGRYCVMVTNAGGGYSRWSDLAVSRYREDITRDCWGQFVYLRDTRTGRVWSATHQPVCAPAEDYHCIMAAGRAEFRRRDGEIETHTEITVSPEDDVEVRRLSITNRGMSPVTLEVTSYFEIALSQQSADQAHRAFTNLFVETESLPGQHSILFSRRPRSADEERHWGMHSLACDAPEAIPPSVETDRRRFLGRGRRPRDARASTSAGPLSGTVGAVLDPICSIRRTVRIAPFETVRVAFSTGVAHTRDEAIILANKYQDARSVQHALDMAWGTSEIDMREFGIGPAEAVLYQRLATRLLMTDPYSRLKRKPRRENHLPVSGLWGLGISGDHPILLIRIGRVEDTAFVRQMLLAHQYWRHQGFRVDLVVLNTRPTAYTSELEARLGVLMRSGSALHMMDRPGGVFLRQTDQIDPDVLGLLESLARVTLEADAGTLKAQLDRRDTRPTPPAPLVPTRPPRSAVTPQPDRPALVSDCGYGGIDPETGDYVIVLNMGQTTPAPWINVIAMPEFGTLVSESGVGCTWAHNSHENRLTTWNNDAVSDGSGELFYLRDDETGEVWSPTALPVRDDDMYIARHGRGRSTFEHATRGIASRLEWFVPIDDPVRVAALTLTNLGEEPRRISATHFVEWVLGDSRSRANQRVVTSYDSAGRMLVASSYYNEEYPGRVAFLACDRAVHSFTADRTEFLGRNGTPASPASMKRIGLGGLTGRYHDNCGAIMSAMTIEPGASADIRFFLGQCGSIEEARKILERQRHPDAVDHGLARVSELWAGVLDTLTVSTPDPLIDTMINRALYQAVACRLWGRTGLYQNSGAFGFRDQLQDVLALTLTRPDLTRAQIVDASRRQFTEGDVLHWWQPHSGRGVRTRFSDDRLWLPYVTAEYVASTGDLSVLDEETPFVVGPTVPNDREDLYLTPSVSEDTASVYEHCLRAFDASRGIGAHDLPLIGGGDWNDGMNRVGREGRGESVWLAWFLAKALRDFASLCDVRGDTERAKEFVERAERLAAAVEREAWDGSWYRRAYFDDGTPLGTSGADECRIDAIAQAWAVLSGVGDPVRARTALDSVEEKLVRREEGLIALLAPPFDHMEHDPGYIKGYVPGVRENGGQYTHAALWVVMAEAAMGDGDRAVGLLDMINPLAHAQTRVAAEAYRVEPYTVVADVYAVSPHIGRGGWSWYTGSAALFHTAATRSILGFSTRGDGAGGRVLVVDPTIPRAWAGFDATLRLGSTVWRIRVENPRGVNHGVQRTALDGRTLEDGGVPLVDDGREHDVIVTMLGG